MLGQIVRYLSRSQRLTAGSHAEFLNIDVLADLENKMRFMGSCRIPDDCIDSKRYPLFMARDVMRVLIEQLQAEGATPS